ncbi:MAG: tetratricopeptide repeat protein [Frankiaceae bacterium]
MDPTSIRLPGAVDLSARAPAGGAGAGASGVHSIDVTEATFSKEVLERSRSVPVVIDFWAAWCGPCRQLSPILERLAEQDAGRWILAKIDVDANPRIAQAAQVQGIPAVKAVVDGQLIAEFTGAVPEREARSFLDQILAYAQTRGAERGADAAGAADGAAGASAPAVDPDLARAEDALTRGDMVGAAEAYRAKLASEPGNEEAKLGLARVELIARATAIDQKSVRSALERDSDDIDANLQLADLLVAGGHVDGAFDALVGLVRRTSGADRDRVRRHLVSLFETMGDDDPAVAPARRALTAALY